MDKLEPVACPLCHEQDGFVWATENGFTARKCQKCGTVYMSPRPPLEAIGEAARTGEHRSERRSIQVTGHFHARRVRVVEGFVRSMYPELLREHRPVRWLDIGAGHGESLVALEAVLPPGSSVEGVEPNEGKRRAASSRGIALVPTLDQAHGAYDIISLLNVYSHLPDPAGFLLALKERLTDTGSYLIETGNGAELHHRSQYPAALYLPDHLSFVGEPQVKILSANIGMRLVATERRREDTVRHCATEIAKLILRRPHHARVPYTSRFRSLVLRLDRDDGAAMGDDDVVESVSTASHTRR